MRAKMSNPDSGVRNLRPDLYAADATWLGRTAEREARAILEETEPAPVWLSDGLGGPWAGALSGRSVDWTVTTESENRIERKALAEALSRFAESDDPEFQAITGRFYRGSH
jgi:hypothetical protein